MPLKVNVGLSRKVGEANYGSRGANINIEMEFDSTLVSEPGKLQSRIRQLFGLVRSSLAEELNGNKEPSNGNGNGAGNGHASAPARRATQSQVKAIYAIAKSQRLDLAHWLRERFHVDRPEDLSIKTASQAIDELKGTATQGGGRS
jgi:hypothetical protein